MWECLVPAAQNSCNAKYPASAKPKEPSNYPEAVYAYRNHVPSKVRYTHSVVTHGWTKHTRFIDHETAVK